MSTYRLERLFAPRAVALVGGSPRQGSVGRTILRNLRAGGFEGRIDVVNPRHAELEGIAAVPRIEALDAAPDLAIVTVPPAAVPETIAAAAEKGVAAAIVVTAGLGRGPGSLAEAACLAARRHGLRLLGPNCLGVMAPYAKLNASIAARAATPGDLALISQSGAVAAGLIEWATERQVGFSGIVSLADMVDIDFADCLDFFAADRTTRAILLYVESIGDARKFMSAARAAARAKPVMAIKSGRHAPAARAAATHTGALAGADAVYEAAFRRAGLLRVRDLDELFSAAETLGRQKPFPGKRLAILTNGGGLGVLAVDRLMDLGGTMAALSEAALGALDALIGPAWSRGNPVDIRGDADAVRYAAALDALLADSENDAVLVLNVPTALARAPETARAVAETVERARGYLGKPVFAVWLGADAEVDEAFEAAGIPHFPTESDAVQGFMHLVNYREAQTDLMETPDSLPRNFNPDLITARRIVARAIAEGRAWLDPLEVNGLMRAYDIPVVPLALAGTAEEAAAAAGPILAEGGTVAVKILSPDIIHKSEIGGVHLDLTSAGAVRKAALDLFERAESLKPGARVTGVTVQPMVRRPKARELIAGIADDPTFGPVVVFGRGGTAVEVINDKALALPPLDLKLASDLIAHTRVARLLKAYRDVPAADEEAVVLVLVKIAQLAADLPEIRELEINPLLADRDGVIAVDARVKVAPVPSELRRGAGHPRFAVRPYPKEWERQIVLRDGRRVFVRPVRPEDEGLFLDFVTRVTDQDLRLRFFAPIREFSHAFLARLVQIDYARAIAFVALDPGSGEMMGVVRLHTDANHRNGEYAILLRSDLKGIGLGYELMLLIIEWARAEGLEAVEGQVLRENTTMLELCEKLGFTIRAEPDDPDIQIVRLVLAEAGSGWAGASPLGPDRRAG